MVPRGKASCRVTQNSHNRWLFCSPAYVSGIKSCQQRLAVTQSNVPQQWDGRPRRWVRAGLGCREHRLHAEPAHTCYPHPGSSIVHARFQTHFTDGRAEGRKSCTRPLFCGKDGMMLVPGPGTHRSTSLTLAHPQSEEAIIVPFVVW
jgi:hypothetical protein